MNPERPCLDAHYQAAIAALQALFIFKADCPKCSEYLKSYSAAIKLANQAMISAENLPPGYM